MVLFVIIVFGGHVCACGRCWWSGVCACACAGFILFQFFGAFVFFEFMLFSMSASEASRFKSSTFVHAHSPAAHHEVL